MLILSILLLLSSNAVSLRRDKSILYARVVIAILISCFFICATTNYSEFHAKGLGLYGGLYQTTALTHIFHMSILIISMLCIVFIMIEIIHNKFIILYYTLLTSYYNIRYQGYNANYTIVLGIISHILYILISPNLTNEFLDPYFLEVNDGVNDNISPNSAKINPYDDNPSPPIYSKDKGGWTENPRNIIVEATLQDGSKKISRVDFVEFNTSEYSDNVVVEHKGAGPYAENYEAVSVKVTVKQYEITLSEDQLTIYKNRIKTHEVECDVEATVTKEYINSSTSDHNIRIDMRRDV